jgi:hypothetical protein
VSDAKYLFKPSFLADFSFFVSHGHGERCSAAKEVLMAVKAAA